MGLKKGIPGQPVRHVLFSANPVHFGLNHWGHKVPTAERLTFDDPPVKEVALGRTFLYRPDFQISYFGAFWDRIRKRFPKSEDASTIVDPTEAVEANFSPRALFVSSDSHSLVQIQQNRFHFNWRQTENRAEYVRFPAIQKECLALWSEFDSFVTEMTGSALQPVRAELTYTNLIDVEPGQSIFDLAEVALNDGRWATHTRFLSPPKAFSHVYAFELPDQKLTLQVTAVAARRPLSGGTFIDGLKLELTVRGPCGPSDSFEEWGLKANDFLVRGFTDLTKPAMHSKWKLRGE